MTQVHCRYLNRWLCIALTTMVGSCLQQLAYAEPQPLRKQPLSKQQLGQAILLDRQRGHCLLCHQIDQLADHPNAEFQGNLGPDLSSVGLRLTPNQLRDRVTNPRKANPNSVMPSYYLTDEQLKTLHNVAIDFVDQPILSATEISNLVAYLATLRQAQ